MRNILQRRPAMLRLGPLAGDLTAGFGLLRETGQTGPLVGRLDPGAVPVHHLDIGEQARKGPLSRSGLYFPTLTRTPITAVERRTVQQGRDCFRDILALVYAVAKPVFQSIKRAVQLSCIGTLVLAQPKRFGVAHVMLRLPSAMTRVTPATSSSPTSAAQRSVQKSTRRTRALIAGSVETASNV